MKKEKKHKPEIKDTPTKDNEADKYKERYIRTLADYQNLSKRLDEEKRKSIDFANESIMRDLIGILNDIEIALSHIEDDAMKKILEKLLVILNNHGLKELPIVENETEFNPKYHEAIESRAGANNVILQVYRKGYLLNDKLIQPAIVAVGIGNS